EDRQRHDAGYLVAVQRLDARDRGVDQAGSGLRDDHNLAIAHDLALPAVDRVGTGQDVDAGGEPLADQRLADAPWLIERRGGDDEDAQLHGPAFRFTPSIHN